MTDAPRILVTRTQLDRFGDRLRAAAPGATWFAMDLDGTIRAGDDPEGGALDDADVRATVAFGSTDLFDPTARDEPDRTDDDPDDADDPGAGAPDRELVRAFFVHCLRSETLRWFHVAAAGVDDPVFGMLLDKGVRLTTSHHTAIPIAEYVLAQVLRARLPLAAMDADRRSRRWRHRDWEEVAASRWLVVGLGSIGSEVAVRARAFGAHVTGVRRTPRGDEPVDAMATPEQVPALVPDHDVIVLAVPATAGTTGMVDADLLASMAPGTILVNVGRGALVDEDALRAALDRHALDGGRPAAAVLDVAVEEPPAADSWLWDHPSVVLTAHTSSGGRQRLARAVDAFAENLVRWAAGRDLLDEATPADRP